MRNRLAIAGLCVALILSALLAGTGNAVKISQPGSGGAPTGAAGGDLGGTYPNPTVISGAHVGAGTLPNASLVTTPITACSGDVNAACSQVTSGAHLGAATVPNTAISGWPLTYYVFGDNAGGGQVLTANKLLLAGTKLDAPVSITNITVQIAVADGANNSDLGLYSYSGNLLAHIGAQHLASTGFRTFAVVGGPIVVPAGRIFLAATSAAGTLSVAIGGSFGDGTFYFNTATQTSSGGALPSTISVPGDAIGNNSLYMALS